MLSFHTSCVLWCIGVCEHNQSLAWLDLRFFLLKDFDWYLLTRHSREAIFILVKGHFFLLFLFMVRFVLLFTVVREPSFCRRYELMQRSQLFNIMRKNDVEFSAVNGTFYSGHNCKPPCTPKVQGILWDMDKKCQSWRNGGECCEIPSRYVLMLHTWMHFNSGFLHKTHVRASLLKVSKG